MSAPLIVAVPSKGRLQDATLAAFAGAGLALTAPRGAALSRAHCRRRQGRGRLSVGARDRPRDRCRRRPSRRHRPRPGGGDNSRLADPRGLRDAARLRPSEVVVAVPEAWIDVETMADLDDVAADFRPRHAAGSRSPPNTSTSPGASSPPRLADYRIVESLGATKAHRPPARPTSSSTSPPPGRRSGQRPEDPLRRGDPEIGGASRRQPRGAVGRRRRKVFAGLIRTLGVKGRAADSLVKKLP